MARGRMIDKRVSMSKKLGKISDESKVLWFMILPHIDREGRIAFDDLEDLKDEIIPKFKDWELKKIADCLNELADIKLIRLYPNGENIAIQYERFEDFQTGLRKDREAPSKIKSPTSVDSGVFRISPALRLNKGNIKEGRKEIKKKNKEKENSLIPTWIPKEEFEEYKKMRMKIKKPMTDRAVELAIKKLETLKSEGYDPQQVLEQSILNSWQGLFPLKDDQGKPSQVGQSTKKTTPEQDEYYKARQKKEAEIRAKHKRDISDIRKAGDTKAWDILQEKIAEELREWSMNYRKEKKGGQE